MPHDRARLVTPTILKKLRFFPIVALQGARQTGKSFLARQILPCELRKIHYLTLDDESLRSAALASARSFLIGYPHAHPLVIDEAQKCPALFDALKLLVDRVRNPGRFILLGSTEFSRLSLIREALTGRMGRVRVFPMTLSECPACVLSEKKSTGTPFFEIGSTSLAIVTSINLRKLSWTAISPGKSSGSVPFWRNPPEPIFRVP